MSAIVILLGFSLLVAVGFLIAYLWAVRSGQYDDKYTPSVRILMDDNDKKKEVNKKKNNNELSKK
jgi:cbb3-type cytochrome oxidase maturation protein